MFQHTLHTKSGHKTSPVWPYSVRDRKAEYIGPQPAVPGIIVASPTLQVLWTARPIHHPSRSVGPLESDLHPG